MDLEISPERPRRRLSYALTDLAVIVACSAAFFVVVIGSKAPPDREPPVDLIARDLGTTPEHLNEVSRKFIPPPHHGRPSESQRLQVAIALDIPLERLDRVMEKYRPDRLHQR
ncbi:hypothetical protein [Reyranella sp.]|uniref:hypothetical protein n=1 Tax=Reyranella sp. TaxID=1929291 RepID=UPI003BAA61C3